MAEDVPEYYFRIRENGAAVFRLDKSNRQRRIEMEEIASVNVRNGNVKPHGDAVLSARDQAAIGEWLAARVAVIAAREVDDILRLADQLNLTAQWAHSRADGAELAAVTEPLLLAMHDLRAVLVRRKSERRQEGDA